MLYMLFNWTEELKHILDYASLVFPLSDREWHWPWTGKQNFTPATTFISEHKYMNFSFLTKNCI